MSHHIRWKTDMTNEPLATTNTSTPLLSTQTVKSKEHCVSQGAAVAQHRSKGQPERKPAVNLHPATDAHTAGQTHSSVTSRTSKLTATCCKSQLQINSSYRKRDWLIKESRPGCTSWTPTNVQQQQTISDAEFMGVSINYLIPIATDEQSTPNNQSHRILTPEIGSKSRHCEAIIRNNISDTTRNNTLKKSLQSRAHTKP